MAGCVLELAGLALALVGRTLALAGSALALAGPLPWQFGRLTDRNDAIPRFFSNIQF